MGYFFSICFCLVINKRIHFSLTPSLSKSLIFKKLILLLSILLFFTNQSIAADVTIASDDSGDYSFTDGDTLSIKNASEASGKLTFSGSTTISGTDNNDEISGELNASEGSSLTVRVSTTNNNLLISGQVNINGSLTKTGNGILKFQGDNDQIISNGLTINTGQVRFTGSKSNQYQFNVTVANGANASVNQNSFASGNSITVQSGGSLNFYHGTGSGRTYGMNINLAGSGNNNFNSGTAATLTDSGDTDAHTTLTGLVTLNGNASVLYGQNDGSVSSTGRYRFGAANGSTTTVINLGSNTFTLLAEGTNSRTYDFFDQVSGSGTLDIDRYTVANFTQGEGSFADTVNLDVQGTLLLDTNDTIASLTGTSTGSVDLQNIVLTIDQDNDTTYAGVITDSTGTGSIIKSGTGTLTLSGTNTYSGNTTINAGVLSISNDNNLGTTPGSADVDNIIFNGGSLATTSNITFNANRGVTMTGAGTINVSDSTTSNIQGVITGSGALTKTGSGTLTLSGTNTYTGNTIINSGTFNVTGTLSDSTAVSVASGATYDVDQTDTVTSIEGAGNIDIASSKTLTAGDGNDKTSSGIISGSGAFTKVGSGTQTLSGNNTYTGATTISVGTLTVSGTLSNSTAVSVASGATYDVDQTDTVSSIAGDGTINIASSKTLTAGASTDTEVGGVIEGSGTFVKAGSGTLTLSGTNTYSGATTINAGTLTVSGTLSDSTAVSIASGATYDVDASDTVASIEGAGNIEIASSQTLTAGDGNDKTISGDISGSGGLTKIGSGTQTLSGNNSYTGITTINTGTLKLTGSLSDSTAVSIASGATFDVDSSDTVASIEGAGNIDIASSQALTVGDSNDKTSSGVISGSGTLSKVGSGTLTLAGTNTKTGSIGIAGGTLSVSSSSNLGATPGSVDGDNIVFNNNATLKTTSSFTLASNKGITMTGAGKISTDASTTLTYGGVITDSGALTKTGAGTLILTGENTYTGATTVSAGTLTVGTSSNGSDSIIAGNVSVEGGVLSGGGVIDGNVAYASSAGTLAPGNSIGTLTVGGNLTLSADDTTEIEFNATSADKIIVNGNTIIAGTISLFPEDTTYSDTQLTIVDGSGGGTFAGTFATKTMNNESNLNDATWDISYDTVNKKVFLDLSAATDSCNINCKTSVDKFKDVAKVFDNATTGTLKEVADVLKSSNTNSVNSELNKLKGTVLGSTHTQTSANHSYFNRALSSVTSSNTSLVSNFISSSNELTLASLQDNGLYGKKENYNEYYDYSDNSALGFIKNNKNRSLFENFETEDRSSFLRTYGTNVKREDIGSSFIGYKSETAGLLFGEQFKNNNEMFSGYSYGFTGTDTDYNNNNGQSNIYSMHASIFKQYEKEYNSFHYLTGAYISKTKSDRNVSIFGTSVNDKYKSDYWDIGINQEAQYVEKFNFNDLSISPSFKLGATYVFKGDVKETGGDLALNVDNENLFILKPEIGLSLAKNLSKNGKINNDINLAVFASQDHFIKGTKSSARFASGSSFNIDLPKEEEIYYSAGLGYNYLNKENNTSLMANIFLIKNDEDDMNSNIFSFTFRKLFGEFKKGRIPPVIVKKIDKQKDNTQNNTKEDQTLEELEENIKIVLKKDPSIDDVEKVYNSLKSQDQKNRLTLNDVYNNLAANCYAIEKNLSELVKYYNKLQLYSILDKCARLSEPKVHLIADRLHQIQNDEKTLIHEMQLRYLRFLNYIPFITFIALVLLFYEIFRRFFISHFNSRNRI